MNSLAFKVNWNNLKKQFTKKFSPGDSGADALFKFYFESVDSLICFVSISGTTMYAEVPKAQMETISGFKLEYLSDAKELVENPLGKRFVLSEVN